MVVTVGSLVWLCLMVVTVTMIVMVGVVEMTIDDGRDDDYKKIIAVMRIKVA